MGSDSLQHGPDEEEIDMLNDDNPEPMDHENSNSVNREGIGVAAAQPGPGAADSTMHFMTICYIF